MPGDRCGSAMFIPYLKMKEWRAPPAHVIAAMF